MQGLGLVEAALVLRTSALACSCAIRAKRSSKTRGVKPRICAKHTGSVETLLTIVCPWWLTAGVRTEGRASPIPYNTTVDPCWLHHAAGILGSTREPLGSPCRD